MDNFCIDLGTLLDKPSVKTLVGPEQHSVHWYVPLLRSMDVARILVRIF
jgi:hypothetical protein